MTLTKGFWMAKTEVTQAQWKSVMGYDPSNREGDNLPVEMNWNNCQAFCQKAGLSLPTEAEWEYACRAGSAGRFAAGFADSIQPVGQEQPNAWGLCDMHGNVWEWCADWYGKYPNVAVTNPIGADFGDRRVLRGGAGGCYASDCRSANRYSFYPNVSVDEICSGFRPVARQD